MIFKVLYQVSKTEAPVRERTESLYIKADSIRDVRSQLADRNYNIEYIQELSGDFLDYEKQSENFKLENE
jgi:DNA-dependent RNA polymerase auxiliary subunit epsilon